MAISFPIDPQQFDSDDRISFSKLDEKFTAVHDDGTEYQFAPELQQWQALSVEGRLSENILDQVNSASDHTSASKRKHTMEHSTEDLDAGKAAQSKKKQKPPPAPKQNTAVYVTGLPSDATVDEIHTIFSRKAGLIAEEIDSKAPRIKLYNDDNGDFKGDALIVFFKPQSVQMAIMLLDDTDFRITASGTHEGRIRVQAADSSYKKVQRDPDVKMSDGQGGPEPEKRRQINNGDRRKIIKKTQKLDAKLADWDDDDEVGAAQKSSSTKWDKMVILTQMFTLQELKEDPAALLDIKEDVREECAKLGTVTNVVLFDKEPDGIVSVKYKESESASLCIRTMHGRKFDGRVVEAFLATGQEKFERSKQDTYDDEDEDD